MLKLRLSTRTLPVKESLGSLKCNNSVHNAVKTFLWRNEPRSNGKTLPKPITAQRTATLSHMGKTSGTYISLRCSIASPPRLGRYVESSHLQELNTTDTLPLKPSVPACPQGSSRKNHTSLFLCSSDAGIEIVHAVRRRSQWTWSRGPHTGITQAQSLLFWTFPLIYKADSSPTSCMAVARRWSRRTEPSYLKSSSVRSSQERCLIFNATVLHDDRV